MWEIKKSTCYPVLVGIVLLCIVLTGCDKGKNKNYTIGVINLSSFQESTVEGFKEGMTNLGYVEGKNVTYIYEGTVSADKLDAVAQDLVKSDVNLILTITTPATKAAQKATTGTNIPIVFIPVTDPVGAGVVESLLRPGGNTTGVTPVSQEGKRLEWLLKVAPKVKKIYIVYNPKDPSPVLALKTVSEMAAQLGVELITCEALTTDEAYIAFKNVPKEADAIFFLPDSVANTHGLDLIKIAIEHKLPTSGPNMVIMNDGALTSYGVDLSIAAKKQAARLADQILHGTSPADLPVESADLFWAINLKTAQAIGLTISDEILRQCNIIIR